MPEFYTIFARKIVFARIWGGGRPPVSYVCALCTGVSNFVEASLTSSFELLEVSVDEIFL